MHVCTELECQHDSQSLEKNWEAPQKDTYFRMNSNNILVKESPLGGQLSSNRWNI